MASLLSKSRHSLSMLRLTELVGFEFSISILALYTYLYYMSTYNIVKYNIFWYYINTFTRRCTNVIIKSKWNTWRKNLTPYWLGKQTGISQNNILKICNGETSTIRFDTIEKICTTLDCSISDLFTSDDPKMKRLLAYAEIKINKSDTP